MVVVHVRHVRVSDSLALRGGAARQLRVCKAHVANSRSERAVCSVTPRLLSTRGPWRNEIRKEMSIVFLGRLTSSMSLFH